MAKRNLGETTSVVLAAGTAVGLIAWTAITHLRVPVEVGILPAPNHWFTSAVPVWIALGVTCVQVVALGIALVRSTAVQTTGIVDEFVSYGNAAVPAIILLLVFVNVLHSGPNHLNGTLAFLVGNVAEMILTKCGWTVANRRPGGVIGGVQS